MRSALELALLLAASASVSAASGSRGCYTLDDSAALGEFEKSAFQSLGGCTAHCASSDSNVITMQEQKCWCIDAADKGTKVDDDKCNFECPGFPMDMCGSDSKSVYYSTYEIENSPNSGADISSSKATASATKTSSSMVPVSTSVVPESQSDTKKTAKDIANSIIVKYQKQTDLIPGLLGSNYSFAVNGMMWNTFVDYWALTGDESFVSLTKEALLFQQGPDQNFMPPNQTLSIGNDDQATWALAAMSAVENKFPQNADAKWLDLAINTANSVHSRWDTKTCKGGLRWQVFSSNEGYSYKDASSNTKFFQLSARLFAHTGNETYATWANQTHNWLQSSGVISDSWKVYDGIQVENCEIGSKIQWTAPIGSLMSGYAYLYNATGDATWKDSLTSLWNATSSSPFFVNNIMTEAPCVIKGKTSTCNIDQLTFKGILAAGMGAAARLVPSLSDSIDKKLQASAAGAVKADGSQFWAQEVTDPKAPGVSEQLSELSVVISTLSSTVNNSTANATDGDSATASGTADVKKGAASRVGTSGMATMALVAGVMWAVL